MRTVTGICALLVTAMALTPLTGFAQGHGQGQGQGRGADQPRDRAQVERGQSDMDRDRMRDRDRIHDPAQTHDPAQQRDQVQDRTHAPDNAGNGGQGIYGHQLMRVEEQNQYREQLRLVESDPQQQQRFQAQHQEKMQVRAREQGVTLDEPAEAE